MSASPKRISGSHDRRVRATTAGAKSNANRAANRETKTTNTDGIRAVTAHPRPKTPTLRLRDAALSKLPRKEKDPQRRTLKSDTRTPREPQATGGHATKVTTIAALPTGAEGQKDPSALRRRFSKSVNTLRAIIRARASFSKSPSASRSPSPNQSTEPTIKIENTYQVEPLAKHRFRLDRIRDVVQRKLHVELADYTYEADTATDVTKHLAGVVNRAVKKLDYQRYRIISNVLLSQLSGQSLSTTSRCLWNPDTDSYTSVTYKGKTFQAVAAIHIVHLD